MLTFDRILQMCYAKRKRGLLKKAMEIVELTGAKVVMTIIDPEEKHVCNYKSFDGAMNDLVGKVQQVTFFDDDKVSLHPGSDS